MTVLFKFSLFLSLFFTLSITNRAVAQTDSTSIELNIFPNPNSGTFYITLLNNKSYQSQLYAMDGRLVKTINLQSGLNYISINVPAGFYFLNVSNGDTPQQFKVEIK